MVSRFDLPNSPAVSSNPKHIIQKRDFFGFHFIDGTFLVIIKKVTKGCVKSQNVTQGYQIDTSSIEREPNLPHK